MTFPCATCGAPATSTFNDGSPRWGADHPPHPPIRGSGPSPWESLRITLDEAEQKDAAKVAKTVAGRYRAGKVASMKYVPAGGRTIGDVNLQGFGAEVAVARWSGLVWNRGNRRKPDVGTDVEVRCVRRADGMLAMYDYDKGSRRFVLAIGSFPTYQIVGWIPGRDGMKARYWHPKGSLVMGYTLDVDRWLVPATDLRGMETFDRVEA